MYKYSAFKIIYKPFSFRYVKELSRHPRLDRGSDARSGHGVMGDGTDRQSFVCFSACRSCQPTTSHDTYFTTHFLKHWHISVWMDGTTHFNRMLTMIVQIAILAFAIYSVNLKPAKFRWNFSANRLSQDPRTDKRYPRFLCQLSALQQQLKNATGFSLWRSQGH